MLTIGSSCTMPSRGTLREDESDAIVGPASGITREGGDRAPRILVVDDDGPSLRGLAALLAGDGYEVVAIEHGTEAIAALRRERFDAVITDFELPDANGDEIARAARETQGAVVPVVVISSSTRAPLALAAGADALLEKPIDYDALLAALNHAGSARTSPHH